MKTEDLIKKYMETRIGMDDDKLRHKERPVPKPARPVLRKD